MDKISINNIFSSNNDFKPLDVNSLFDIPDNKERNKINFNIDKLIKLREDRKKKILVQYEKVYNICLNKIDTANNFNKTNVIYEIPEGMYGHSDYNVLDCVTYVNNKLQEMNLDTFIIGKTIYISWLNLADNIKAKNKD